MEVGVAESVRELVLARVGDELAAKSLTPSDVPPTFDLLLEGVIDSFGMVELIMMLEREFEFEFDFDELDAEEMTKVGPLADYVAMKLATR